MTKPLSPVFTITCTLSRPATRADVRADGATYHEDVRVLGWYVLCPNCGSLWLVSTGKLIGTLKEFD